MNPIDEVWTLVAAVDEDQVEHARQYSSLDTVEPETEEVLFEAEGDLAKLLVVHRDLGSRRYEIDVKIGLDFPSVERHRVEKLLAAVDEMLLAQLLVEKERRGLSARYVEFRRGMVVVSVAPENSERRARERHATHLRKIEALTRIMHAGVERHRE